MPLSANRIPRNEFERPNKRDDVLLSQQTLLKILPVMLLGPKGSINTYGLLDEGSTVTPLSSVCLFGPCVTMAIKKVGGFFVTEVRSEKVSVKIKRQFDQYTMQDVRTVNNLSLTSQIINDKLLDDYSYLPGLNIKPFQETNPAILIGQDNWDLIVTRDIKDLTSHAHRVIRHTCDEDERT